MKGRMGNMIIKIDLEKAFDRLEWSSVRQVLHYFNFPNKLYKLIMFCISTSFISILTNGASTQYFQPTRGIRQGDPISPYLFILTMELFSRRINHEVDLLNWSLVFISRRGPKLFHLFFADNLTFSAKATKDNCQTIKRTLESFSNFSGQKINRTKSKVIFSKNFFRDDCNYLSSILNIQNIDKFGNTLAFLSSTKPPLRQISNSSLIT